MNSKTSRMVICKGTWPEHNYKDFQVFSVRDGESDEEAISRAKEMYSKNDEFYVKEIPCQATSPY